MAINLLFFQPENKYQLLKSLRHVPRATPTCSKLENIFFVNVITAIDSKILTEHSSAIILQSQSNVILFSWNAGMHAVLEKRKGEQDSKDAALILDGGFADRECAEKQ